MQQSWPILVDDDFARKISFVSSLQIWLTELEAAGGDYHCLYEIGKRYYLPIETIVHTCAELYFILGNTQKCFSLLHDWIQEHPDPIIHSLYLRTLMALPGVSKQHLKDEILRWNSLYLDKICSKYPDNGFDHVNRDKNRKLNIAFICSYMNTAPAINGIHPIIKNIPTNEFNVLLISLYEMPAFLHHENDYGYRFVSLIKPTPEIIINVVQSHQIDILIDTIGRFRMDNPLEVFVAHPAPIQISWGNMLCTNGLNQVQYVLGDKYDIPKEDEPYYTEKVFRFESEVMGSFDIPRQEIKSLPALNKKVFTFGSFNALFKINDEVLTLWLKILKKALGSHLIIKGFGVEMKSFSNRILETAKSVGLELNGNIHLQQATSISAMLQAYDDIDLALNTFPYTAGSTAVYALMKGVPSLTYIKKDSIVTGGGVGVLKNLGLDEFIVYSEEAYIEKALHYVAHPQELNHIRLTLFDRLKDSARFNPERFGRDYGKTCRKIWHDWVDKH